MPTQNLEKAVKSLPIKVRFAGFESDTLRLAQAGWDLSMVQNMDQRQGRPMMQLAMNYDVSGGAYRAISSPLTMDYGFLQQYAHATSGQVAHHSAMEMLSQIGFDIIFIGEGNRGMFRVMPMRSTGVSFASQFSMIDPVPQETIREEHLSDFKFFKVASAPKVKDLIVAPEDVSALLEKIHEAHRPLMDKIRKRERSRENEDWMRGGFRPAQEVQAQIITLGA